jgi:hypothetical protein
MAEATTIGLPSRAYKTTTKGKTATVALDICTRAVYRGFKGNAEVVQTFGGRRR